MSLTPEQQSRIIELSHDLAREGRTPELAEFIEHGVPVDLTDAEGNSLLMLAAYHSHAETVAMLIARGADVDLRNSRNQSAVAGAIFKGADEVVEMLKGAGADLDAGTPSARQAAEMFGRPL